MANRKKKTFSLTIVFVIFGVAGIAMLIGGFIVLHNSLEFRKTAVEITGTVVEIDSHRKSNGDVTHSTYVDYSYGGQDFLHVHLGYYSSTMYIGKEIPLLVDPDQPGHMTSKAGDSLSYTLLLIMGAAFTLFGFIVPLTCMTIRSQKGKKLLQTGKRLSAIVESVDFNTSITYNGRHPYVIFCTYQDAYRDVTYRFKSKNLMQEPNCMPGDSIEVYVDPEDYSKYIVNVDALTDSKVIDYT